VIYFTKRRPLAKAFWCRDLLQLLAVALGPSQQILRWNLMSAFGVLQKRLEHAKP
jgi:hypothetical protein